MKCARTWGQECYDQGHFANREYNSGLLIFFPITVPTDLPAQPQSRIANGEPMEPLTHPFMVALFFPNKFCNGVLIGEKWNTPNNSYWSICENNANKRNKFSLGQNIYKKIAIDYKNLPTSTRPFTDQYSILTTASCLSGQSSVSVFLGSHDLTNSTETHMDVRDVDLNNITSIIHEDYDPINIHNDLGMIFLEETASFCELQNRFTKKKTLIIAFAQPPFSAIV